MVIDRRLLLGSGLSAGLALPVAAADRAGPRPAPARDHPAPSLAPAGDRDRTDELQQLIDRAAPTGTPVVLPPGRMRTRALTLRAGTRLLGTPGASVLAFEGGAALLAGAGAADVTLDGLVLDGALRPLADARRGGLVVLQDCPRATLRDLDVRNSAASGIVLARCSGRIRDSAFATLGEAAIFSIDALGLEIAHNRIERAANNGILVWRSAPGEDGTIVTANRIEAVAALAGGAGENGNAINVFRAAGVLVTGNRIADCAYSAVRGNAASNLQVVANSCRRIGEVALYAEFAFEGALFASNLVDTAATGVSVTNFNVGGRLAVVQGNLIRNLLRREHEPEDKRGEGIAVEADAAVTGNVIESAPTIGIMVGWGRHQRQVAVTSNVIRNARIGIGFQRHAEAGSVLVAQNLIAGTRDGAIRTLDHAVPVGPDLARNTPSDPRWQVGGNLAS